MQSYTFVKDEPIDIEYHVVGSDFYDTNESHCGLESLKTRANAEPEIKEEYYEESQSSDICKDQTEARYHSEVSVRLVPLEFCDDEDIKKYVHRALSKTSVNTTHSQKKILEQPNLFVKMESIELEMLSENTIAKSSTDSWYAMPYDFCEVAHENKQCDEVLRNESIKVEVNKDSERDVRNKSTDPRSELQPEHAMIKQNINESHQSYECDICEERFPKKSSLRKHFHVDERSNDQPRTQPTKNGNRSFKCDNCQKAYTQLSHLYRHQKSHRDPKFVKCSECEKTFLHSSSLRRHMLIHTEEKLVRLRRDDNNESAETTKIHKCEICDMSFSQRYNLTRHFATHKKSKEYTCDVCKKKFILKSYLYAHILTHLSEELLYCDSCPRYYKRRSSLMRHIDISHSEKKRYECQICKKSWKHKASYKSHTKRVH